MDIKEYLKIGIIYNSLKDEIDYFYWYLKEYIRKKENKLIWLIFHDIFINKFERINNRYNLL
jgi:hypothetical protein